MCDDADVTLGVGRVGRFTWSSIGFILLGIGAGTTAESLAQLAPAYSRAGTSIAASLLEATAGTGLVIAGAYASSRRPPVRGGVLLGLAGIAWFVAEWRNPGSAPVTIYTIGLIFGASWPAFIGHAALAIRGPMDLRSTSVSVAGYAIAIVVLGVIPALAFDPTASRCPSCPDSLVSVWASPQLVLDSTRAGDVLQAIWAVTLIAIVVPDLVMRGDSGGIAAAIVLASAAGAVVVAAVEGIHGLSRGFLSNDVPDLAFWAVEASALLACAGGSFLAWSRVRAIRRSVVRLALDGGLPLPTGRLEAALRQTLRDPRLTIAFPIGSGRFVDANGERYERTAGHPERVTTVVTRAGAEVARIDHRADLRQDPDRLVESIATARLALENERLHALSLTRLADLRESRARIVAASDAERNRIERDLHDGSQQRLVGLAIAIRLARIKNPQSGAATEERQLERAELEVRDVLAELRELAAGVYPRALTDQGLAGALEDLVDGAAIPVRLDAVPVERFDPRIEATAYLVAAEIVRPAVSRSATVRVTTQGRNLAIDIDAAGAGPSASMTLELGDRVGALGGTIAIERSTDAWRMHAELPCAS